MASRKGSALEQIFFQVNSALGKGLEAAFQKAIIFRDSIDYTGIDESEQVSWRYTQMHKFAKITLFPDMQKVIKENTNIEIDKIIDVESFCGYFAIDISLGADADVRVIIDNQTGLGTKSVPLDQTVKEIADLSNKFNEIDGKFTSTFFGKGLSRKISATLWMDVDMAFLIDDNLPHGMIEAPTAGELAAIYLHEVGHMCTMLAAAGNAYYQVERITAQLKVFQGASSDPKKFVDAYLKDIRPNLNEMTAQKKINPKIIEIADNMVEQIKYYENGKKSDIGFGLLELLYQIFVRYLWFNAMIFFRAFMFNYIQILFIIVEAVMPGPGDKGKSSDVAISNRNRYQLERAADEFVARHGYSGQLASGLSKIMQAIEATDTLAFSGGKVLSEGLRKSKVFNRFLKLSIWTSRLFRLGSNQVVTDMMGYSSYESDVNRLKRIIQQTQTAFKNSMSRQATAEYLMQYDLAKKALDELNTPSRKVSDFVWNYFFDTARIVDRIWQMDQQKEMEQMLNEMDEIINNALYVRSAQFKHMK